MTFDWSISISTLIQSAVLLSGGLVFLGAMRQTVDGMRKKQEELQEELVSIRKVLTEVAVQNSRLDRAEQDIRDLRRGRGLQLEDWPEAARGTVGATHLP